MAKLKEPILYLEGLSSIGEPPPMPYYLEYETEALYQQELARVNGVESAVDPSNIYELKGFQTEREARRWYKQYGGFYGKLSKTVNLYETTTPEQWPLRSFEWDFELIEEW